MKKILSILAIMMVTMTASATRTITKEWNLVNLDSQTSLTTPVTVNLDDYITLSGCSYTSSYYSGAANYAEIKQKIGLDLGNFDYLGVISIQPKTGAILTSVELTFSSTALSPYTYLPSITPDDGNTVISDNKLTWTGSIKDDQFLLQFAKGEIILTKVKVTYVPYWEYNASDMTLCSGSQTLNYIQNTSGTDLNIGNQESSSDLVSLDLSDPIYLKGGTTQYYITTIGTYNGGDINYSYGFMGCSNLETLKLPASLKKICSSSLNSCTSLKTVTFEEGSQLKTIEFSSFVNNTSLESLELPEGLTTIGPDVFYGCTSLTSITLPKTLESIGNMAFYDMPSSATLYFKSLPKLDHTLDTQLGTTTYVGKVNISLSDDSYIYIGDVVENYDNVNAIDYTRTMANQWGTIVLPFPVKYNASNGNYKLYYLKKVLSDAIRVEERGDTYTVAAGTPMIIKAIGEKNDEGKYDVNINAGNDAETTVAASQTITATYAVNGLSLNGTYKNVAEKTGVYFIAQDKFWYADEATTIPPFRSWFEGTPDTSNAKAFNIIVDEETDGITSFNDDDNDDDNIYNIAGQRVGKNAKGIVIINGKKVLVK